MPDVIIQKAFEEWVLGIGYWVLDAGSWILVVAKLKFLF